MGVMKCSRNGCEKIMCDTYIPEVGYLCGDCQDEFDQYMRKKFNNHIHEEGKVRSELRIFMDTKKNELLTNKVSVEGFFKSYERD